MKSNVLLVVLMLVLAASGTAQEKGTLGLLFKTGGVNSVGASYELSDTLAIRASLGFDSYKAESEIYLPYSLEATNKQNSYNASLGLFLNFLEKKDLTLYGGLEFGYTYYKQNEIEDYDGYQGDAILGVRHKIGKHLAVFGELGLGFTSTKMDDIRYDGTMFQQESTRWNLKRSGIGIVFYL